MYVSYSSLSTSPEAAFPPLLLPAAEVPRRRGAAAHATARADPATLRATESLGAPGRSSEMADV